MNNRRDFLKGSLVLGVAVAAGQAGNVQAGSAFPPALVYTKDNPGRWAGKEGAHVPKVAVAAGKVTILTPHPMTPPHFIVKRHAPYRPSGREATGFLLRPKRKKSFTPRNPNWRRSTGFSPTEIHALA